MSREKLVNQQQQKVTSLRLSKNEWTQLPVSRNRAWVALGHSPRS